MIAVLAEKKLNETEEGILLLNSIGISAFTRMLSDHIDSQLRP